MGSQSSNSNSKSKSTIGESRVDVPKSDPDSFDSNQTENSRENIGESVLPLSQEINQENKEDKNNSS